MSGRRLGNRSETANLEMLDAQRKVISNKDHTDLSVILNEVKDLLFRQKQILRCRSE